MDLTSLIAIANVGLGIFSAVAAAMNFIWVRAERRAAEKASDTLKFAEAIRSNNISQLGGYLENTIGGLSVADYASDVEVRHRVDDYLDHIVDFLSRDVAGLEWKFPHGMAEAKPLSQVEFAQQMIDELNRGEVWNSLAKLRRHIELSLRQLARVRGLEVGERIGAGQLISRLEQSEAIDSEAAQALRQSVAIANRAIHGEDVVVDEARLAILLGLSAISRVAGT